MPRIKQFAFAIALTFSALLLSAQAQTPGIEVVADHYQAQFSVHGEAREMRVEIFSPSGEMVFDSGAVTGQGVAWNMQTVEGQRVADGVYLATISIRETSGKIRKRIEQITVRSERQQESALAQAPNAVEATITGDGTSGTIAKFTGASTIGDSVITENANKIGISTTGAPTAKLHINGGQPATSANTGANATNLLQTSGGKGGNTTGSGKTAGKGASISLLAGNGGNAVSGSKNGNGGSITLQPGSAGTGGTIAGATGNVLLAPMDGNVGIGTDNPGHTLEIVGTLRVEKNSGLDTLRSTNPTGFAVVGATSGGTGVYGTSFDGTAVRGDSESGYAGYFAGKVGITGSLGFGSTTRQMLNLYNAAYGIGVQNNTFYSRTNVGFAWYKGGTHNNAQNNAGGGTVLMRLDSAGNVFANSFNPTSDRHMKDNFSSINSRLILTRLAAIPIQTWNFKGEGTSVRHLGPTAQDFRSAFNLGTDDKHIATVDADGVALAAIQGLYQMMQQKDRKIQEQSRQIEQLQARLSQVERAIKKRRTRKKY